MAALAVLVYHVRYRFFLDYGDLETPRLTAKLFYAMTAFGHDAVVVFFVLSGYFISASVMRDGAAGRWSWTRYAVSRWVRLTVVLVPGLLLTASWDGLGLWLFGSNPVYSGVPQAWQHDFFSVADRLTLPSFLGNLAFLQTIVVPPFGSNEPLWSLSFEFWYYVLFPCAWFALTPGTSRNRRVALAAAFLVLLPLLGRPISLYFPIWLLGFVVARLPHAPYLRSCPRAASWVALVAFLGLLVVSHTSRFRYLIGESVVAADYVTGCSCAVLLYVLLHDRAPSGRTVYARTAASLAGFSYTLYVTHMPVLVFLRAAVVPSEPWRPDLQHIVAAGLVSMGAMAYAMVLAHLTESRTDDVREWLFRWIGVLAGAYIRPHRTSGARPPLTSTEFSGGRSSPLSR